MTWAKIADQLTLAFISLQGVILLVVPDIRDKLYVTVSESTFAKT